MNESKSGRPLQPLESDLPLTPEPVAPRGDGLANTPEVVAAKAPDNMAQNKIQCDACPVLCQISAGRLGACDRWGNVDGVLKRMDPVLLMRRPGVAMVAVAAPNTVWDGSLLDHAPVFISGVGSGTTYPDYKPAPFIVASQHEAVDMVTVVTEGIFSYCSFKIKIDTDRYLGPEQATVRYRGESVGHVTTIEYGSQFLSLGGVHHLTGGSKKEGRLTCDLMLALGNQQAVDLAIEGGAQLTVQAGRAPIVNGVPEERMRVGCGSATIGIFAKQWFGHADEVVVVDDHITGVLSEHQAGRCLDMVPSGIRLRGRKSTPGRYFQVANPGTGWGGTDIRDPLTIIEAWNPKIAKPGMRLLMVSTTGEHADYFVLDENLNPQRTPMPDVLAQTVQRIGENCEPAMATVLFVGGAGGSLRAGVTDNPVLLTRSIKNLLTRVTCGGAPAYVWPGGGITVMVDVARMPAQSFGSVPTPAIVAPIEFTLRRSDYQLLGGHMDRIQSIESVLADSHHRIQDWPSTNPWPQAGVLNQSGYE
jgi:6-hydroxynicotinate reductase